MEAREGSLAILIKRHLVKQTWLKHNDYKAGKTLITAKKKKEANLTATINS